MAGKSNGHGRDYAPAQMDRVTSITELFVGLACLALAAPMWRRPGVGRGVGMAIGVAGIVAILHAIVLLV